jgi:acetaldehyde dehydrogenase (acetylating)
MLQDKDLLSLQEVRTKVEAAYSAFQKYRGYTQQQVDTIVEAMAAAGRAEAKRLAEMAVEETRYGNVKDKIAKNLLNADLLARSIRSIRTVGVLREIPDQKIIEIGVPVGVVAALLPTTNPTSTVIFKSLISLKAGNAVVISPHPRAAKCTAYTADLLHKAAVKAGAPEGLVQCVTQPTLDSTNALMKHPRVGVILATGGSAMVRAAYSSGKPAFGVGPGNVPVYVERSADIPSAVKQVVEGKSFDYGTVCSSEQALVAEASLREAVIAELRNNGAYFTTADQKRALEKTLLKENYRINPECVGQSPQRIAEMAGFTVPAGTKIIVAEIGGVGKAHPLSVEKLSPVLALLFVQDHGAALDACEALLRFGGLGHTCVIYSKDDARIREFGARMPAMRVLVNTAAPAGSTGMTTNVMPSMTLGCGAMAGNITSDNVGPQHLINIKRVAWKVRNAEDAVKIPAEWQNISEPARTAAPQLAGEVDRQTIATLVEQYLAERGVKLSGSAPAALATVKSASLGDVASQVVDRFLGSRGQAQPACAGSAACPCSQPQRAPEPPRPAEPPKPKVEIVPFVCENDVRMAVQRSQKIYIGTKTIVTPAARDLGEQHGILVMAQP